MVDVAVGVAPMGYGPRTGAADEVSKKIASLRQFPYICVLENGFSGFSVIYSRTILDTTVQLKYFFRRLFFSTVKKI